METRGIFNLSVESDTQLRFPARIGLLRRRTGVPVFLLFLQGVEAPTHTELHSLEAVEREMAAASTPGDKQAWESLLPFFHAEGTHALVAVSPLKAKKKTGSILESMLGSDKGLKARTGIHQLKAFTDWADLVVVPQASLLLNAEEHQIFYQALLKELQALHHFFAIVDFPLETSEEHLTNAVRGFQYPDAAAYHPWMIRQQKLTPPGPVIAAHYQVTDKVHGIQQLPANLAIPGGFKPIKSFGPSPLRMLNETRVNVLQMFSQSDIRVWGGRTLAPLNDADSRFVSSRRTLLAVKEAIEEICYPFVMEPLTKDLPLLVEVEIGSAMAQLQQIFSPEARPPFKTSASLTRKSTEDVLEVNFSYSIPYAVDEVSFQLGMAG